MRTSGSLTCRGLAGNHEYDYRTGKEKHSSHSKDPSGADRPYDPDWGNYGTLASCILGMQILGLGSMSSHCACMCVTHSTACYTMTAFATLLGNSNSVCHWLCSAVCSHCQRLSGL